MIVLIFNVINFGSDRIYKLSILRFALWEFSEVISTYENLQLLQVYVKIYTVLNWR